VALALLAVEPGRGAAQRFYPDDPLWTDDDRAFDASGAAKAEVSEAYDFVTKSFTKVGDRRDIRALNVNTLDEVPDSSWFTNRIGRRAMSIDEISRGPDSIQNFDITDWVITADKGAPGFQPGFRAHDARDKRANPQTYQLEGDTEDYPELASGVEMIGTFFYHAMGYNVVDTYVVNVDPKRITIAPTATFEDANGDRKFRQDDLEEILKLLARNPDGTYRMTASRFVEGRPLESFDYVGTRPDDPNDIHPHEHRRELRGNRVFAAWLNHDDSRAVNSLDMLVQSDGTSVVPCQLKPPSNRCWIRHFMFDFGSLLGSSPRPWSGVGYMYEGPPTWKALLTFGFWMEPWQRTHYPSDLPDSVGRVEADAFDPVKWKPEYPNPAFDNMRPDDAFWAAKIVAAFSDEAIAAIVAKAKYTDTRAAAYIAQSLIKRRDKIAKVWLNGVNPLVDFELSANGELSFQNAAVRARAATPVTGYAVQWSSFDNVADSPRAVGGEETVTTGRPRLPASLAGNEYVMVTIRSNHPDHPAWNQPVRAYFRKEAAGWKTVGIDR
jgi:hypothetical protein